jgi:hypothetical protein
MNLPAKYRTGVPVEMESKLMSKPGLAVISLVFSGPKVAPTSGGR